MNQNNKIAITDIKSIYTSDYKLYNENGKYPQYCNIIDKFWEKTNTGYKYAPVIALEELFSKKNIEHLKSIGQKKGKNALIIASGTSEWAGSSNLHSNIHKDYNIKLPYINLINIIAGTYANKIDWTDYISTDATACASSYKAFYEAELLIKSGEADRVIVIGVDDQINSYVTELFGFLKNSLTAENEHKGLKPSAFDNINQGFRLGHGIGYVVFESDYSLTQTNNSPIAFIKGTVLNGEKLSNPFGQSEDGNGYANVIKSILNKTNLDKSDISFIKTHGTGTSSNNTAEKNGIESVFSKNFIATSYKPEIGHTLGSNGIVELSIAIEDSKNGFVRGIKNRTIKDNNFLSYDKKMDIKNIMLLASGMGNVYASSIVEINK